MSVDGSGNLSCLYMILLTLLINCSREHWFWRYILIWFPASVNWSVWCHSESAGHCRRHVQWWNVGVWAATTTAAATAASFYVQ